MGSFYSFLISNDQNIPCGQTGCCSLYPHLKQLSFDSTSDKNLSITQRFAPEKSTRDQVMSQNNSQIKLQKRDILLTEDEEDLLDQVLDAYITHKGSQHRMAQTLARQLNADLTKMETLCCTLCELIEAKIQTNN